MSTQTESLNKLEATGRMGAVDAAVLANIKIAGPICRSSIARITGLSTQTLCGSIGRLKARHLVMVQPGLKVYDNITKRNVQAYVPVQCVPPVAPLEQ